ncbi:MAG: hydantoinase B/oxoprolinase family protein, partial [Acetobacteraceae bacterium]
MCNRFAAIAEEASHVAYHTAHTTFVKQTQDYQVALAGTTGEFFAYPMHSGVTSSVCQNVRGLVDEIGLDRLAPGDIIITNDPFSGGALCTHTIDIHLIRPVFHDGAPIAFAWAFIHASDIGGAVPGSISPTSYEVFQEGVRIRPSLLYRRGELDTQRWSFFADNSRIPDLIWGDLQAMLAGLALLDRRAQELCDRIGTETLQSSIDDVLALSELKARQAIARLADGAYAFRDDLETYRGEGHIFIHARMEKCGKTLAMNFSGSDPQVR